MYMLMVLHRPLKTIRTTKRLCLLTQPLKSLPLRRLCCAKLFACRTANSHSIRAKDISLHYQGRMAAKCTRQRRHPHGQRRMGPSFLTSICHSASCLSSLPRMDNDAAAPKLKQSQTKASGSHVARSGVRGSEDSLRTFRARFSKNSLFSGDWY